MKHADSRPRVHIWPRRDADAVQWSLGPCATPHAANDAGDALNSALATLDKRTAGGVVVIVEPPG